MGCGPENRSLGRKIFKHKLCDLALAYSAANIAFYAINFFED